MKTLVWIALHVGAFAVLCGAQGRVSFDNISAGPAPVTIRTNPGTYNPSDGPAGDYVGSSYSVSLVFVNGTVSDQSIFDSSNPIWVKDATFFGTTGTGGDGAGFFDGASPQLNGQTDFYVTAQLQAWFNGNGAYTSYAQALAAGHNVGLSKLIPLYAPPPPGPVVTLTGLLPFTVGIPEPSSVSLLLLGLSSLAIFRRRHKANQ